MTTPEATGSGTPHEDTVEQKRQERAERIRCHNVSSGMVQCSGCLTWFYDEPGNFCSFCANGGAP